MAEAELTPRERAVEILQEDLQLFCEECLKIKPKVGRPIPFRWNKAQHYVHMRLEEQKKELGYVRALILKGRQQGISTYIGARYYHQTSMRQSTNAFIMAHEEKATNNLYKMVKRYHAHNPLKPMTKASNAKELIFGKLDGGYGLATAGSKDVGRSNTAQLFHGSEFGFWENAQDHLAGIGNTIADDAGTEMVLESTGNGLGNAFHLMWQNAEAGIGDYIAIFVPWFWEDGYAAPVKPDFVLSKEDLEYQRAFKLSLEQMQWRANKIATYGTGHEWLFDQEYPATAAMAFQSSTMNPLISPMSVSLAVANRSDIDWAAPLVIGVDPAEEGLDRTAIAFRMGRTVLRIEYHEKLKPMQVAGLIAKYHREGIQMRGRTIKPDAIFVDKIGIGSGIYDRALELNIPAIGVMSSEAATDPEIFHNKRAEMWWAMRDWIEDMPCRLPNDPALLSDLSAPQPTSSSNGRKLLESKKDMKKRGMRSPDGGDALAMTFYAPVERIDADDRYGGQTTKQPATQAGY